MTQHGTTKLVFVLGAADPEMKRIEQLLRSRGYRVVYAMCRGKRVFAANAYEADAFSEPIEPTDDVELVFVECRAPWPGRCIIVDHHRPGDPGYGKSPEEFWQASSLGQVYYLLHEQPTREDYLIAAADHCLAHAYKGLCPGVDPDELMRWRAASRAAFQKRAVADVLADIERARQILRTAPKIELAGVAIANLLDHEVPELPEAAAREGVPFVSTVREKDGRKKVVLQVAPPEAVSAFLRGEGMFGALTNRYGDPARGFAGGFLP
ncbi:MAG: hypothetical protein QW793_04765 [Candidatus Caldarchaeum sp.]